MFKEIIEELWVFCLKLSLEISSPELMLSSLSIHWLAQKQSTNLTVLHTLVLVQFSTKLAISSFKDISSNRHFILGD